MPSSVQDGERPLERNAVIVDEYSSSSSSSNSSSRKGKRIMTPDNDADAAAASASFRTSVLPPIHEIPTRSRLHTAETDLIRNCRTGHVQQKNDMAMPRHRPPPPIVHRSSLEEEEEESAREDLSSVVSSLSKDDSLYPRSVLSVPSSRGSVSPPTEVSIPAHLQQQQRTQDGDHTASSPPDWLSLQPQKQQRRRQESLARPRSIQRDYSAPAVMMGEASWMRPRRPLPPSSRVRNVFTLSSPKAAMNSIRPTLGRHQSCPSTDMSSIASTSSTNQASSTTTTIESLATNTTTASWSLPTTIPPATTTVAIMDDMDALLLSSNCEEEDYWSLCSPTTTSAASSASAAAVSCKLLGERQRRRSNNSNSNPSSRHHLGQASSSLVTASTAATTMSRSSTSGCGGGGGTSYSYAGSDTCHVRKHKSLAEASRKLTQYTGADDGAACCTIQAEDAYYRRGGSSNRNVVKDELKYMMGVVSAPIKKIPLLKKAMDSNSNVELERKGGCLT